MTKIKDIESKLETILAENNQAIQECENNINQSEQAIKKANNDLLEAQEQNNAEAYDKAKKELWTAENIKELQVKQLEKLQKTELLSSEQSQQLRSEVFELTDSLRYEQFKKASELLQELKAIANQSLELRELANKLLNEIKYDLQKVSEPSYRLSEEYKKDMVHGLYEQLTNAPMFDITLKEGAK